MKFLIISIKNSETSSDSRSFKIYFFEYESSFFNFNADYSNIEEEPLLEESSSDYY